MPNKTPAVATKPNQVQAELEKRIADVIKDIDNDGVPDNDDLTEEEENDPELLAELAQITGGAAAAAKKTAAQEQAARESGSPAVVLPTTILSKIETIKTRIEMYELAMKASNEAGESTRTRRFERGLQTLNEMLKKALTGDDINENEIPPEVSLKNVQQDKTKENGEE